jgi:hypothetical protein
MKDNLVICVSEFSATCHDRPELLTKLDRHRRGSAECGMCLAISFCPQRELKCFGSSRE